MFEPHGCLFHRLTLVVVVAAAEAAAAGGAGDVHHRALRRFGARRRKQIPPGNQPNLGTDLDKSAFGGLGSGVGSVPGQHAVAARHHVSAYIPGS